MCVCVCMLYVGVCVSKLVGTSFIHLRLAVIITVMRYCI